MRIIDADKLYPDCMTKDGKLAISQSQIANAPTVEQGDSISREYLKKQVKELLNSAIERVNDTPTNSPCYRAYVEQENERTRFIDLINNAPSADMKGAQNE